MTVTPPVVEKLRWEDPVIRELHLPGGVMTLRYGFGSGLARRADAPTGRVWAIGDRGPNIKVRDAVKHYGLHHLQHLADLPGAKIMTDLEIGPTIAELQVEGDRVELVRMLRLCDREGRPITGLPNPGSDQLLSEPVFDLEGAPIIADPEGLDTEGLVALSDGGFWVGDEFGPSLVRLDAQGRVVTRLLPRLSDTVSALPTHDSLPAIAARRQLNRGFEALTLSPDERWLLLGFQSPLAHPDEETHRQARHVRLWRLDATTGAVVAHYAYPLDTPESFRRDCAKGPFERSDVKVSELLWLPDESVLVLERGSETTKVYRCRLDERETLADSHIDPATRPTLEQLSAGADPMPFPVLAKQLIFTSDDAPEVAPDLEGMALLSPTELLLVSDNDFGVEGAITSFWRLRFPEPLFAPKEH